MTVPLPVLVISGWTLLGLIVVLALHRGDQRREHEREAEWAERRRHAIALRTRALQAAEHHPSEESLLLVHEASLGVRLVEAAAVEDEPRVMQLAQQIDTVASLRVSLSRPRIVFVGQDQALIERYRAELEAARFN